MNRRDPNIGDTVLNWKYELLRQVQGSLGGEKTFIGEKHNCRFCGNRNSVHFRKTAHTFPESLGNRWVISLDECDLCNEKFSKYENDLAAAVRPFLTVGGIRGKKKIPQSGSSEDGAVLLRNQKGQIPSISMSSTGRDFEQCLSVDKMSGTIQTTMPIADIKFRPRLAYKALTKMAYALLPDDELENYKMTREWLSNVDDNIDFPVLEVALSFSSIGNAPSIVAGTLLRRTDPSSYFPHILFLLCAGSICLQIDLRSDHLEDHIPAVPNSAIKIEWSSVLGDEEGREMISLNYGTPIHHNWSSSELTLQPVESFVTDFNPRTLAGKITPRLRKQLQA